MAAPDLPFEHAVDIKKGWFDMASLDYSAKLGSVSFTVPRGRVVHLEHVDGKEVFLPGVRATDVAIFLLNGATDADVSNPGTTASGRFVQQAISPSGKLSGVVATGGYEIDSTEFHSELSYVAGDLLTAPTGSCPINSGTLTNASVTQFVTPVVGVVSSGKHVNHNGVSTLSFWSVWLPGAVPG